MPIVPVRERQVASTPLRAQGVSAPKVPKINGGEEVFKVAESIFLEEKKKADQIAVLESDLKNSEKETSLLYDPEKGLLNRKGKDAFGIYDEAKAEWDNHVAETEKSLATDEQRLSYRNRATARWADINRQIQRHVGSERKQFDDTTTDAFLANERDAAALNYQDPERIKTSIETQRAVIADYANRNGLPSEWLKMKIQESESKTHAAIITRMLANGEDMAASDYYKANKTAMTGTDATALEKSLEAATTEGEGTRIASDIWGAMGPKDDLAPVNMDKMADVIREKYGTDEKLAKAAISSLKERAELHRVSVAQRKESAEAMVWRAVEQDAGVDAVRRMPEYLALPGDKQVSIKNHIVDRVHTLAGRKDEKPNDTQWANYWNYSDPERLGILTEDQIQNLLPKLGRKLTNDLMKKKRALGKAEVLEVTIDSDLFKELANEAGLKSYENPNKISEREKAELGALRSKVESLISAEQSTRKRKLTREEKEAVMRKEIDKTVTVKAGWFGTAEKPAAVLQKKDIEKVIVPAEEKAKIKEAARRRGETLNEDQIKQWYIKKVNSAH